LSAKKKISIEEAKHEIELVCRRLGLLHISYARTLVDELGEEKGREMIMKAIKDYGIRVGKKTKKEGRSDLPRIGMHDRRESVEVGGETRVRAYGCVMAKVWKELGEDALGRLYCHVDPAKSMTANPDQKLIHTKNVPDGDEYCELVIRPTTEQEREDFESNDKDWSYIDK